MARAESVILLTRTVEVSGAGQRYRTVLEAVVAVGWCAPRNLVRSFRRICEDNKIRTITVHLRHTIASLLKDLGVRRSLLAGSSSPRCAGGSPQLPQPLPIGHDSGMVVGMATRKVTITLDEVQLDQIRSLVQAGTAASVSGFVQHAVAVALDDVAGWGAMLAEALRATGGELSDKERAWADEVLGTGTQPAA